MCGCSVKAVSVALHSDVVVKSQKEPQGNTLSTFCAIVLATLAICGADSKPLHTVPNETYIAMAASVYPGSSNGTTFRAV